MYVRIYVHSFCRYYARFGAYPNWTHIKIIVINNLWGENRKENSYPSNRPWRPIGLWDVKNATLSRQSAQLAVRLSALRISRDPLPRNINFLLLELISVTSWVQPQGLVRNEGLCKLNIYSLQRAPNPRPSGWHNRALSSTLQSASMCVC
jgi:hypothetical protein